jgi:PilZ domain
MENQPFKDRREGGRVVLNRPVRLILNAGGQPTEYEAVLLDASERGACLVVRIEVKMGEDVEVVPQEGPGFSTRGRVVWIAEFRTRHENHVGIQFAAPHAVPSWRG